MVNKTSVIDVPKNAEEKDLFGIDKYEKGLTKFARNANTPITMAIQGEWGSGKTSLMYTLRSHLCEGEKAEFYQIWLNTWEYSLLKDAPTTLINILNGLLYEVMEVLKQNPKCKLENFQRKASSFLAQASLSAAKLAGNIAYKGVGDELENIFTKGQEEQTIGALRKELENCIIECIKRSAEGENPKKGFIFFIDDLDRIEPPIAVQILELLKNIFTIEKCIFVLAIDYDVIVKGLKPKFGELTDKNEREFRSFFDKIIQLPFSMPLASYSIDEFLLTNLKSIGFLNETQSENKELISSISEVTGLAAGTNPRALKRLTNSLSLINCINSEDSHDEIKDYELLVNYALVNLQVAYPPIYRLLANQPDFESWNESMAIKYNLAELDKEVEGKLSQSEEFDETWEKFLFRFCDKEPHLKKNSLNISRLLNLIRKQIPEEEKLEDVIESLISLSSVTSVEAFDKPVVSIHKSSFLKELLYRLTPNVKAKLGDRIIDFGSWQKRIQSNLEMFFQTTDGEYYFKFSPRPTSDGIYLYIQYTSRLMEATPDYAKSLEEEGILQSIYAIDDSLQIISEKNPDFEKVYSLKTDHWVTYNHFATSLEFRTLLNSADDIQDENFIEKLALFISEIYPLIKELSEISKRYLD